VRRLQCHAWHSTPLRDQEMILHIGYESQSSFGHSLHGAELADACLLVRRRIGRCRPNPHLRPSGALRRIKQCIPSSLQQGSFTVSPELFLHLLPALTLVSSFSRLFFTRRHRSKLSHFMQSSESILLPAMIVLWTPAGFAERHSRLPGEACAPENGLHDLLPSRFPAVLPTELRGPSIRLVNRSLQRWNWSHKPAVPPWHHV